jgi:hypothetical protein
MLHYYATKCYQDHTLMTEFTLSNLSHMLLQNKLSKPETTTRTCQPPISIIHRCYTTFRHHDHTFSTLCRLNTWFTWFSDAILQRPIAAIISVSVPPLDVSPLNRFAQQLIQQLVGYCSSKNIYNRV